mmetsp:Transcript_22885/g.54446  ORF Transcript_22885/g.54446 Transcript_22885/m.54446 type:complete len:220 (+) Transcript_22885:201-860(+)
MVRGGPNRGLLRIPAVRRHGALHRRPVRGRRRHGALQAGADGVRCRDVLSHRVRRRGRRASRGGHDTRVAHHHREPPPVVLPARTGRDPRGALWRGERGVRGAGGARRGPRAGRERERHVCPRGCPRAHPLRASVVGSGQRSGGVGCGRGDRCGHRDAVGLAGGVEVRAGGVLCVSEQRGRRRLLRGVLGIAPPEPYDRCSHGEPPPLVRPRVFHAARR